jgi:hypothetical protein
MHRSHLLAPLLIAAAASMFLAAPAAAQSYVSITGCSVSPEEIFLAPGESATLTLTVEGDDEWAWTTIVVDGVVTIDEAQRTSDIGGQVSWLAGQQSGSTPSRFPSGAGSELPDRTTISPPTVAGTAAVLDRIPLTACGACRRLTGPVQGRAIPLERASAILHPVASP